MQDPESIQTESIQTSATSENETLNKVSTEQPADSDAMAQDTAEAAPQKLDPRLAEVRGHVPLSTFFHSLGAALALSAVSLPLIYLLGGAGQFWKATSACGISILATILGMVVLLRPVDALNFVGMVYFSVLIRMGLGLGSVFIMRQIDTPLFGSDWVGYLVFYYSVILLIETVLVVLQLNSTERMRKQNASALPDPEQ